MGRVIRIIKIGASGIVISFFMLLAIFLYCRRMPYELFLQQAIPFYGYQTNFMYEVLFNKKSADGMLDDIMNVFSNNFSGREEDLENRARMKEDTGSEGTMEGDETEKIIDDEAKDSKENSQDCKTTIESEYKLDEKELDKLRDISYLRGKFYTCDKKTDVTENDFDIDKFLVEDTSMKNEIQYDNDKEIMPASGKAGGKKISSKPQILIFHTHSTEMFKNSKDISDGVLALGDRLAEILQSKYRINALHHTKSYDLVDGKPNKRGAYERMEPDIIKVINENPTLEVAIDIHRDGVADTTHLVETINNKPTAKIMFVNGLCKLKNEKTLEPIENLPNPYLKTNLALSFKMQLAAYNLYPKLVRKIYINAYRYSLNMLPKSLLIEVGAQTNTKEEALNAMEPLADILATVLLAR